MDIAIDFDGTCVTHAYPAVGMDVGAVPVLKELLAAGHNLILNTMRSGGYLSAAEDWFSANGLHLYGSNINPTQRSWTDSPKVYAQFYIDDAALGIPLVYSEVAPPYVDWPAIRELLVKRALLPSLLS